jgi:hypothetical protein
MQSEAYKPALILESTQIFRAGQLSPRLEHISHKAVIKDAIMNFTPIKATDLIPTVDTDRPG